MAPVLVPREWKAMSGRLIFPIRDDGGVLVGFAGRGQTASPKYINSAAASGYRKGETLYGLYQAKETVKASGEIYLVEGYKDALAMHAAGFTNTVALSGTAFTEGHRQLLETYGVEKAYILMDADKAGREAAEKVTSQLSATNCQHSASAIVNLPEGDDPDSLFRKLGKEAFALFIRTASHPPHETEKQLVGVCLQYPEAIYPLNDIYYPAAAVVLTTIETDGIPFTDPANEEALLRLCEPKEENEGEREIKAETGIKEETEKREEGEHVMGYLYCYYEARLEEQVKEAFSTYRKETGNDTRQALLTRLNERMELYEVISKRLGRPGAV